MKKNRVQIWRLFSRYTMNSFDFVFFSLLSFAILVSLSSQGLALPTSESQCRPTPKITELVGEVRDQKDVGWCFANSGADLLTATYKDSLPVNTQVSSSFVALNFYRFADKGNANKNLPFRYGGSTFLAINEIAKNSFQNKDFKNPYLCLQNVDQRMLLQGIQNTSLEQKFKHFQKIYEAFQNYKVENNSERRAEILTSLQSSKTELISKKSFLSEYDHKEVIKALYAPTFDEAVVQVLEIVCRNSESQRNSISIDRDVQFDHYYSTYLLDAHKTSTIWDVVSHKSRPEFSYIQHINKILDHQKPVSISYKVENVLSDPTSVTGAHASTITDRKYYNNECHYFVRNSWGKKCSENKLVKEFKNGKFSTERKNLPIYKYECEEGRGGFWVPESKLKDLVIEVISERVAD